MDSLKETLDKITQRINTQVLEGGSKEPDTAREAREVAERREREIRVQIPKIFLKYKTGRDLIMDKSLFCYGPAGTGKSLYVAAVSREYILKGEVVKWLSCPVFIMQAQSFYRDEEKDPFEYVLSIAKFGGTLVLDDIGIEKMSDWVRQVLYMLINERYQRELITLITSNRSLKEIDALIHPGIASRIAGMCEVLEFTGKDFRVKP